MTQTTILSRVELESMGPPVAEELGDLGIGEGFLCDLALKHVAMIPEPTTTTVADRLHLPRALTEEILEKLYREKLIEVRLQTDTAGSRARHLDLENPVSPVGEQHDRNIKLLPCHRPQRLRRVHGAAVGFKRNHLPVGTGERGPYCVMPPSMIGFRYRAAASPSH
jgi:hypothetical protein